MDTLCLEGEMGIDVDYKLYLRSPEWQVTRERALVFWDRRCATCFATNNLQVHHRTYKRLGSEQLNDLIVLCDDCHSKFHKTLHRSCQIETIQSVLGRVSAKVFGGYHG